MIIIGLLLRILFSILFSDAYDGTYWMKIQENIQSGNQLYGLPGYCYMPVWGYYVAVVGYITTAFLGIGTLGTHMDALIFLRDSSWPYYSDFVMDPVFAFIFKMVLTLSDLLVAYVLYWLVDWYTHDRKKAVTAFALWWMCPLMIYNSNIHIMFDTLPVAAILLATYFLLNERYFLAGALYSLASIEKLFPAYFLFIFVAYIVSKKATDRNEMFRALVSAVMGAVVVFLLIFLPNILQGNFIDTLGLITDRVDMIGDEGATLWSNMESFGYIIVILLQPLTFAILLLCARDMIRTQESRDVRFLYLMMISATSIFLWTPTATYLLLIIPYVVLYALICDHRFNLSYWAITLSALLFAIAVQNLSVTCTTCYLGLISADTIHACIDFLDSVLFGEITVQLALTGITGFLETLAIYSVFIIIVLDYLKRRNANVS